MPFMVSEGRAREKVVVMYCFPDCVSALLSPSSSPLQQQSQRGEDLKEGKVTGVGRDITHILNQLLNLPPQRILLPVLGRCRGRERAVELGLRRGADVGQEIG